MAVLLFFAFLSGLITILAPCIWPLLPIVLSTSIKGGKAKSLGITLGVLTTFGLLTLGISYLVKIFGIDPNILRYTSVVILIALGVSMIFPYLNRLLEGFVSQFAGKLGQTKKPRSGFSGGFATGSALGVVWTPCAGPIFAAIATLSVTSSVNFGIILVTIAYLIGVGIPLFLFSYGGQKLVSDTRFLSKYTGRIQQIFGVVLLLTAILIGTNYDKELQVKILNAVPSYTNFLINFEKSSIITNELNKLTGRKELILDDTSLFNTNTIAPEITGITNWINTNGKPISLKELKGKVVLIDFWTYTCINCIRTLPYLNSWYEKYNKEDFVLIGVHSPEFEFEKKTKNVKDAVEKYKIKYPVAQDNNFGTWKAFSNQYWPSKYLIDTKGVIRRIQFGEGKYEEMEKAIQLLLKDSGKNINEKIKAAPKQTTQLPLSPETYLGSKRMLYLVPNGKADNGIQEFTLPQNITKNRFGFNGVWNILDEYSISTKESSLTYKFSAGKVYIVMHPANTPGTVEVYLDGKIIDNSKAGSDVKNGRVTVNTPERYELVSLPKAGNHTLKLVYKTDGIQNYAFIFGE